MADQERPATTSTVRARRISTVDKEAPPKAEDVDVVVEAPLVVDVEGMERYTLLCTPMDRRAMAVGFLFSEGVITGMADVLSVELCDKDAHQVNVRLKEGLQRVGDPARNLLISSSCGACGTEELDKKLASLPKVGDTLRIPAAMLRSTREDIAKSQPIFKACGGTHAVSIFDPEGDIVAMAEDTGRHNALDKCIGKCLLEGRSFAGFGTVLSGRVSFDMVGKCARAGIELISAISAPTSVAVEIAERCDITLCAFVRQDRATVFTHPRRVLGAQD